ncbi:sensor histidine kinase [Streptomyces sp. YIM S03343]
MLLLPATLAAAVTGSAAVLAPQAGTAVAWCGGTATLFVLAAAAQAVRRTRELHRLRARHTRETAQLEHRIAAHETEVARLAAEIMPTALLRLRAGESPQEVMRHTVDAHPQWRLLPDSQRALLRTVLDIVDTEEALRDSSQRSFVSIARRVQAIVHQQAKELREMEEDHGRNPEVFDDLLRIDHGTALIGRLADSISVLGGGRPGRQWPLPVPLYSVLRGAMSRILDYRRVELHSIAQVNIRGIHVEPVIHAAAELLDNATRYSPPQTKVHVTAVEVQTGVAIEIEDAGVSLSEEARARAEGMLERARTGFDMQDLGESPRLGLAVVGRLCAAYDMQVSLRASAYGGVRAVMIVPAAMLTADPAPALAHGIGVTAAPRTELGALAGPARPPKKRRPTSPRIPAAGTPEDDVPEVSEWTDKGLPQRRSRVRTPLGSRSAEHAARPAPAPAAAPVASAGPSARPAAQGPEPGLWVEAFMSGLRRGTDAAAPSQPTTSEPARSEADDEGDPK